MGLDEIISTYTITTSIEYDTAVEDLVDLLSATIDGFQLFPPNSNAETKRQIAYDALSSVQSAQGE